MGEFIDLAVAEGVATITLRRPERLNALHPAAHYELAAAFDRLAGDPALRAVILTGAGERAFCAGEDLRHHLETGAVDLPPTGFGGLTRRMDFPVPLIAAINGVALGGGFELALACDIILAADNASFGLPEPKVGWVALSGGVQRLPRAIGIWRAMNLILTGRTVAAAEAYRLGFVSEVTAPRDLLPRARAVAAAITECAPLAIRCAKQVAHASLDAPTLADALDVSRYPMVAAMLASEDALEGKRAFAERRPPNWQGR